MNRGGARGEKDRCLLVDGHVHLQPSFEPGDFLNRAADNLGAAAERLGIEPAVTGVLMLTEAAGIDEFGRLSGMADQGDVDSWSLVPGGDGRTLDARRADRHLVLVAGRQIATRDGLEVLALSTRRRFDDGGEFRDTVEDVLASGALAVLPWGFGKWWLGRGRRVRALLETDGPRGLLLGDNGGRPSAAFAPPLFRLAAAHGVPVLAGSDPLPFEDQVRRVGSYGSVLELTLDRTRPAEQLRRHLLALEASPPTFGRRESLGRFVATQVRMQLRKRRGPA